MTLRGYGSLGRLIATKVRSVLNDQMRSDYQRDQPDTSAVGRLWTCVGGGVFLYILGSAIALAKFGDFFSQSLTADTGKFPSGLSFMGRRDRVRGAALLFVGLIGDSA